MTSTVERPVTEPAFEDYARAVDEAMAAVRELDADARKVADALRESIEAAHRAALVTIVRRLRADDAGRALLYELVDDPLVHLLLSLHGIIRPDPMTQARAALDVVRPALQSHGGDVELVRIEDGVAYVRLSGACNGCSMSSVTMRETVQQALVGDVAAVTAVEVLADAPSPTVIPVSTLRRRVEDATGWVDAGAADAFAAATVTSVRLRSTDGERVDGIVVRVGSTLSAFRDECAHQGLPLCNADVDEAAGTLTCPWHGLVYNALTGESVSVPGAALERLPVRVEGGRVLVRVEA